MKTCPYCAEQIQDAAIKCRFCSEFLDAASISQRAPQTATTMGRKEPQMSSISLVDPRLSIRIPATTSPPQDSSTVVRADDVAEVPKVEEPPLRVVDINKDTPGQLVDIESLRVAGKTTLLLAYSAVEEEIYGLVDVFAKYPEVDLIKVNFGPEESPLRKQYPRTVPSLYVYNRAGRFIASHSRQSIIELTGRANDWVRRLIYREDVGPGEPPRDWAIPSTRQMKPRAMISKAVTEKNPLVKTKASKEKGKDQGGFLSPSAFGMSPTKTRALLEELWDTFVSEIHDGGHHHH